MEKLKNVLKTFFERRSMLLIILLFTFIMSAMFGIYTGVFTLLNFAIFFVILIVSKK